MTEDRDRLERLISRRLDGEVTADEARELDAMIAASPEARDLLRAYERQDELVRSVLENVLGGRNLAGTAFQAAGVRERAALAARGGGAHRVWRALRWPMPLAGAAVLALMIGVAVHFGAGGRGSLHERRDRGMLTSRAADGGELAAADVSPAEDALTDDSLRQAVNREVIGTVGEDGQTIYLLEMDHTRTAVMPAGVVF